MIHLSLSKRFIYIKLPCSTQISYKVSGAYLLTLCISLKNIRLRLNGSGLKRIVGEPNFSDQLKNIVTKSVMQHGYHATVCMPGCESNQG